MTQKRPDGPMHQLTDSWKRAVSDELKRLGRSQGWLAGEVEVSAATITHLLKPDAKQSRLVPKICEVLSIPMPVWEDSREQELVARMRHIRELSPREYDRLFDHIERTERDLEAGDE